jgi:hypothetical protein
MRTGILAEKVTPRSAARQPHCALDGWRENCWMMRDHGPGMYAFIKQAYVPYLLNMTAAERTR